MKNLRQNLKIYFLIFLIIINAVIFYSLYYFNNDKMIVSFLDVGQGDSAFIETPEGHQIIIDGGPNSVLLQKLAEKMPFWDKSIDLVILTHPEKDHMAGLLDLLQRYKVDYFLWTGVVKNDAENKKLLSILEQSQKGFSNNFLAISYLHSII